MRSTCTKLHFKSVFHYYQTSILKVRTMGSSSIKLNFKIQKHAFHLYQTLF